MKFDAFGFATLSLAIGAFQAMLDRGEQLDWFGSLEIRIEALLAALSFVFFLRIRRPPARDRSSTTSC